MTAIIFMLLAAPIAVTSFFVLEMVAGLVPMRAVAESTAPGGRPVVVMPAHDEALIIGETLARLVPALAGWGDVLVVADNCADDTAALARSAGVEVIERRSATERGKGFALAFAQAHLRARRPSVVLVLDADCESDRASLQQLATTALHLARPCQAINLIRPDRAASPMVQMSTFAFMIKNQVRQRGLQRLAGRVHLTGTGMALPWSLFHAAPLATANVVEDVELGLRLERTGFPPQLVTRAFVWSDASNRDGTLVQRTRWEGGFLALATRQAPRILGRALRHIDLRGLAAGLDLCVPPLTLLALIDGAAMSLGAMLCWLSRAAWWPVETLAIVTLSALFVVGIAWAREGRQFIGAVALIRIPLYVAWKIPLYLGLARGAPREWLRTGR